MTAPLCAHRLDIESHGLGIQHVVHRGNSWPLVNSSNATGNWAPPVHESDRAAVRT